MERAKRKVKSREKEREGKHAIRQSHAHSGCRGTQDAHPAASAAAAAGDSCSHKQQERQEDKGSVDERASVIAIIIITSGSGSSSGRVIDFASE